MLHVRVIAPPELAPAALEYLHGGDTLLDGTAGLPREILGNKGYGIDAMRRHGLPVPPAFGDEGADEPQKRREEQGNPEKPGLCGRRRVGGECEVEDDECRDDEEEHRWNRVPRAKLEEEILPGQREDVAEIGHASESAAVARDSTRRGA